MKTHLFGTLSTLLTLAVATGCGSSRDVAVTGTVASAGPSGPVRLEFYQPNSAADAGASTATDLKLLDSANLAAPGSFDQTVSMDGNKLYVVAILDADGSDACTDGEAWGEAVVDVTADNTATAAVSMEPHEKCPVFSSE